MMQRGPDLIADINACQPGRGEAAFWWIGQHSFIIKIGGVICYIDPFLSDLPGRQVPPLLTPAEVTNATLIFGTHDHVDHIDHSALPGMMQASPGAKLIIPQLIRDRIVDELKLDGGRVIGIDVATPLEIAGLTVTAVPAAHELLDVDQASGLHPYLGFILTGNHFCCYHAGDTCIYEGLHNWLRRQRIDLAFVPINGRDAWRLKHNIIGNMTYQEAVDLAGSLQFGTTVPAHFEMFEKNSVDPQLFIDYMAAKYPGLQTLIPQHGRAHDDRVLKTKSKCWGTRRCALRIG